jgi:hypothetical protein
LSIEDPHLGEGEGLMRDQLEHLLVDLPGSVRVWRQALFILEQQNLLEDCIVDP